MSEERKKPIWPWIAAVLVGLLMLYPLSAGPAQFLLDVLPDSRFTDWLEMEAHEPLGRALRHCPRWVPSAFNWYVNRWDALGLWWTGRMRTPFGSPDNDADWIFDGVP